jgi:hypothetical protein
MAREEIRASCTIVVLQDVINDRTALLFVFGVLPNSYLNSRPRSNCLDVKSQDGDV